MAAGGRNTQKNKSLTAHCQAELGLSLLLLWGLRGAGGDGGEGVMGVVLVVVIGGYWWW